MDETILIALGSNRRHGRHGAPAGVVAAAIAALGALGLHVIGQSRVWTTAPIGPGSRCYANAVVAVRTPLPLAEVLARLQALERDFGRRRGQRWGDRVLDLDILAAGARVVALPGLAVPHPELPRRRFVLDPLVEVAPAWRHPKLGLTARQLRARLARVRRPG
ncbi:hypothetical protein IP88_14465 [alpha proteobacterium AAP81b]|nr:hypothetical protein IP88_14465 [alpha proteobacterium AAP81b]